LNEIEILAITSALSFLAAFMPPQKSYMPFDDLQWQPVPVINIPRELDTIIIQRRDCPRYDVEKEEQLKSEEIKMHEEANSELYKFLTMKTGENISGFAETEYLHNSLDAMQTAGWTLPTWTASVFPSKTKDIAIRYLKFLTETDFMRKARGGPLITEIINSMTMRSQNKTQKSIAIYSGHDVTLVNLMHTLRILDQTDQLPNFSAALAIELHENSAALSGYELRMFYFKNQNDENPIKINTDIFCGRVRPCSLRALENAMKIWQIVVHDFDKMCEL
jgi:lysosomal acid phosphatase